jgi:hypothetical protein
MAVKVIDSLPAVRLAVDYKAGSVLGAAVAFCEFLGLKKEAPHEGSVGGFQLHDVPDVLFVNQEKMHRGLGIQVFEGQKLVILVYFLGWNFPACDFTKNTFAHGDIIAQKREAINTTPGISF